MIDLSRDSDELYDDALVAALDMKFTGDKRLKMQAYTPDENAAITMVDYAIGKIKERLVMKPVNDHDVVPTYNPDQIVAELQMSIRRNGAMDIRGNIHDDTYALLMADHAREKIRDRIGRKHLQKGGIIVAANDTGLKVPK